MYKFGGCDRDEEYFKYLLKYEGWFKDWNMKTGENIEGSKMKSLSLKYWNLRLEI